MGAGRGGCFSGNFNKTFDAAGKLTFSIKCRQRAMAMVLGRGGGAGLGAKKAAGEAKEAAGASNILAKFYVCAK